VVGGYYDHEPTVATVLTLLVVQALYALVQPSESAEASYRSGERAIGWAVAPVAAL
jgi:hypothetical protein